MILSFINWLFYQQFFYDAVNFIDHLVGAKNFAGSVYSLLSEQCESSLDHLSSFLLVKWYLGWKEPSLFRKV